MLARDRLELCVAGEGSPLLKDLGDGRQAIGAALDSVIARWRTLCWQIMRVTVVSQTNLLVAPSVGALLCAPKYLAAAMTLGDMVQAAAAFVVCRGCIQLVCRQLRSFGGMVVLGEPCGIAACVARSTGRHEPPARGAVCRAVTGAGRVACAARGRANRIVTGAYNMQLAEQTFEFTEDWFSNYIPAWSTTLQDLLAAPYPGNWQLRGPRDQLSDSNMRRLWRSCL